MTFANILVLTHSVSVPLSSLLRGAFALDWSFPQPSWLPPSQILMSVQISPCQGHPSENFPPGALPNLLTLSYFFIFAR
jgi:hypothetical protein